jgi:UDP:flavonoid glycosyltransferase YjiC (YdhE family)
VYNKRRRLTSFIEAISLGGSPGLFTVGPTMNPAEFTTEPSVAVEQSVRQADVLVRASVMLRHGTMLGAIESGTPMLIVPLGADHLLNAEIAERLGLATVVDRIAAGPEALRAALSNVLASESHRSACVALQEASAAMASIDDLIEPLVALVRR